MINDICIFKRIEKKYLLSRAQRDMLLRLIGSRAIPDIHGSSTVSSLYLDTPDHLLIRNSIDAEAYKEKIRLRSYGTPNADSRVFLELKKKYDGVVYKRRVSMSLAEAELYMKTGESPLETQIMAEIDYAMRFYHHPMPSMLVAYEREAFSVEGCPNLRLTFDSAVRYREQDLFLEKGTFGKKILPEDTLLLEIKTDGAMPVWLSHMLDKCDIRPTSFSKYGTAYCRSIMEASSNTTEGDMKNVCNF